MDRNEIDEVSVEFAADLTKFNVGSDWTGPKVSITLKGSVTREVLDLARSVGRSVMVKIEARQRSFLTVADTFPDGKEEQAEREEGDEREQSVGG